MDEHYRLRTLRNAGYIVDCCNSLNEFRWVLYSGGHADAVAFTEDGGPAPHSAMSLARGKRSPLVLFQGWTPHYNEAEFNLVVPMLTSPEHWLEGIAGLILNTGNHSLQSRARARSVPGEASAVPERTGVETPRSVEEHTKNQGFRVDFLKAGYNPRELGGVTEGFLAALGTDAQRAFRRLMRRVWYPAGTVLFRQGELPHEILFVFGGAVKLAVDSGDGRRFIVRIARPGELLGLAPAFASCPHQVTAEAGVPCEVGAARSVEFLEFLEKYPEAFRAAAQELGRAYNQTCVRLRTIGVHFRVTARLAGLLLEWAESGSESEVGIRIEVGLTHEEIGQCIGTTRESVSRILTELEHRGVLVWKGAAITIVDRSALEDCAGEGSEESHG